MHETVQRAFLAWRHTCDGWPCLIDNQLALVLAPKLQFLAQRATCTTLRPRGARSSRWSRMTVLGHPFPRMAQALRTYFSACCAREGRVTLLRAAQSRLVSPTAPANALQAIASRRAVARLRGQAPCVGVGPLQYEAPIRDVRVAKLEVVLE
jgi:hypothetical protein